MNIKIGIFIFISSLILNSCFEGDVKESIIAHNNAKNIQITLSTLDNKEIIATNNKNIWSNSFAAQTGNTLSFFYTDR